MTAIAGIQKVQEFLAQVWADESLKTKLLSHPKPVLAAHGLEFPDSVEVQVHENTSSLMNYVLPQASELPEEIDLEEIEPVAGKVMELALADDVFKAKLLSDPKSAVAEATGLSLPTSLEICVYEDTPTVKHLVLPVNPASEELSDFELEAIAGGGSKGEDIAKSACGTVGAVTAWLPGTVGQKASASVASASVAAEGFVSLVEKSVQTEEGSAIKARLYTSPTVTWPKSTGSTDFGY